MTHTRNGKWYFYDETGDEHGPYKSGKACDKAIKSYVYWLDNGPTLWQSIYWPILIIGKITTNKKPPPN